MITGAGHHVYADKSDIFNKHVLEACAYKDTEDNLPPSRRKSPRSNKPMETEDAEYEEPRINEQGLEATRPKSS